MSTRDPHARNLRLGRFSSAGLVYFITSNVAQRRPLLQPAAREVMISALRWARDHGRIWVAGYVILDDHFHVMFRLREGHTLAGVVGNFKRYCARQINLLRGATGLLWQEGYHDHMIRDSRDFHNHLEYIHYNPVRRGWVARPEDYAWSTAHPGRAGDIDWGELSFRP